MNAYTQTTLEYTGEYKDPLTEEERKEAKEYVHTGYIDRAQQEACGATEDSQRACEGINATVFGDTIDQLIPYVGMLMSIVGITSGGKITERNPGTNEAGEPNEAKTQTDYCKYIALGTSVMGTMIQTTQQESINIRNQLDQAYGSEEENGEVMTPQKKALYKQAESHEVRKKTANLQSYGYYGTAGCYAALLATSGIGLGADYGTYMRMGASALLGVFYTKLAKANQNYADEVRGIADSLPGAGDCNPITEKDCFCAQPEASSRPDVCYPELEVRKLGNSFALSTGCVDKSANADPQCNCSTSNGGPGCLDQVTLPAIQLSGGSTTQAGQLISQATQPFSSSLPAASVNSSTSGQGAFKLLKKADKNIAPIPLNENQKKIAKAFAAAGLPPNLSSRLATVKPSSAGNNQAALALQSLQKGSKKNPSKVTKNLNGNDSVLKYKKKNKSNRRTASSFKNPYARKKSSASGNKNILKYANKATSQASINKSRSRSVFDIISTRYQKSGFNRLDFELD